MLIQPLPCLRVALPLRVAVLLLLLSAGAPRLSAQQPLRADSSGRDSLAAQRLATQQVTVTRVSTEADRLPWALGAQDARALRRGQATVGIDEALANIPGVVVANRYNYALDQRLSIRGAGSRANFGLRGVKVLLDGVPQSLPDGQSQLTNVDLAAIGRVEVLRGSASSLYGNGSGGVLSFTTDLTAPDRLGASVRTMLGSFGLAKTQLRTSGRTGRAVGAISASRTTVDGFRQYSAADVRQLSGAVDVAVREGMTLAFRAGAAETPRALNPGALTEAEYLLNRDSASAFNVRRGASREVSQRYASLRLQGTMDEGAWSAALFGQRRFVNNALAVAPPAPAGATNGTFATLDRRVTGARFDASRQLALPWSPRLSGGLDLQRSLDVRRNRRSTAGRPVAAVDTLLVDQDEVVTSVGPFAQLQLEPTSRLQVSLGGRWDRLAFRVDDHFLADGKNDSGDRTMTAASGHLGASWAPSPRLIPYINLSTAFETPTTTELQVSPNTQGGFNGELGPQRVRTLEIGARGRLAGERLRYEIAAFDARATDAIVQFLETNGRAFFRNAGATQSRGVEVGVEWALREGVALTAAWTHANYRFDEYRLPRGAVVDTLDGNTLAGVPTDALRMGLRTQWRAFSLDVDHSRQSALWGDDRNTVRVPGWGDGQLNVRATWSGVVRGVRLEPFGGVNNALGTDYIGAVTLNGAGGRVLEPAPLRNVYLGLEIGGAIRR